MPGQYVLLRSLSLRCVWVPAHKLVGIAETVMQCFYSLTMTVLLMPIVLPAGRAQCAFWRCSIGCCILLMQPLYAQRATAFVC